MKGGGVNRAVEGAVEDDGVAGEDEGVAGEANRLLVLWLVVKLMMMKFESMVETMAVVVEERRQRNVVVEEEGAVEGGEVEDGVVRLHHVG